ncbi:mitochondrial 54S ribosomal protein uL24m [Kluyveromyces lactis]|uniref:KLLA0C09647p n=1 Tax=Kluyveromyces lactis (strain ATCC 8585 / CBS 2359 / DSM 70799 / NBRC 1267 / NRRL Y-1140 / WM37) TaxID=284590 RepID=Q6CTW1_KLULA|nr:mitochondrial 54S ribosomal protein YmL40 [Kluyveromyces lactis]CAH01479.1 KLLA0C09647p [Kluyveromyces lactis]|eukprot:XP_452628.1 mitochondrial 54S ribosomal protein YmL40 [Kluyveromyces lactis]
MSSYKHLSKAGARFLEQVQAKNSNIAKQFAKYEGLTMPEFLKPSLPRVEESEKYKSVKQWKYMPGDRVVIVNGKFKGNVCAITQHDVHTNGYILDENGPTNTVPVPKQFWQQGQNSHMVSFPVPVSQADIKLVADLDDPETPGVAKTVAVRDIEFKGSYYDSDYKKIMPYRVVVGENNMVVPWPKPEFKPDGALATRSEIARQQTFWVESVVKNPVPEAALSTIRNPKSKYRRGTLTTKEISRLVAPKMPLTEAKKRYIEQRKELAALPKRKLTDEDQELIGDKVYQHFKKSFELQ